MIDREKVIKGLECCTTMDEQGWPSCEKCPYDVNGTCPDLDALHRDALMLLKAQKSIVYCHECRFYNDTGCAKGFGWCERNGNGCGSVDEWYCADGERRKNDD